MTEYLTEQEQIELLKNWIKQYSLVIIAGVLLAVASISVWRYWQHREEKILNHASAIYDEMLTMRAQNNQQATIEQAKKLVGHYKKTIYGNLATFMLAREAINQKNYPQAEKHLQWALNHGQDAYIRQIARLRLARLFITEHKPSNAIQLLKKVNQKSFNGLIEEIRGDAYLMMKNKNLAREAYQRALFALPNAESIRPLLQMKYDNLATT